MSFEVPRTPSADGPDDKPAAVAAAGGALERDEGTPEIDVGKTTGSHPPPDHLRAPADGPTATTGPVSGYSLLVADEGTLQADAAAARERALMEQPTATSDLQAVAAATGGRLEGLEHCIKSQESLERKMAERGAAPGDVLRYTIIFPHEQMADGAAAAIAELSAHGYTIASLENKWLDPMPGDYRGIHAAVESGTDYRFELQLHTPESYAVKEAGTHDLYEVARDDSQPLTDRQEAELAARLYSSTLLAPPPHIEGITST